MIVCALYRMTAKLLPGTLEISILIQGTQNLLIDIDAVNRLVDGCLLHGNLEVHYYPLIAGQAGPTSRERKHCSSKLGRSR